MDEQVFQLLNDKIEGVEKKVDMISHDVKEMLMFKWQIIGGSLVVSLLAGILMQILIQAAS